MPSTPSPQICLLCGQANNCAVAAGRPPESCWCMHTRIDPQALARIPAAQRGQHCICPACGQDPANPRPSLPA